MAELNEIEQLEVEDTTAVDRSSRHRLGAILGAGVTIAVIVIVILATTLTIKSPVEEKEEIPDIKSSKRLDCLPRARLYPSSDSKQSCTKNPFCYYDDKVTSDGSPKCFYNTDKMKYRLESQKQTSLGTQYTLKSSYTPEVRLTVDFEELTDNVVRFKITKENSNRYEVPIDIKKVPSKAPSTKYEIQISNQTDNFYFKVIRKDTKAVLFDTSIGGLLFEDKKIQIATALPSKYVYGFGENNHESFLHNIQFKSWPIFNRDQAPGRVNYSNLYAAHPFYTCLEQGGYSHGVVLINSNAMEYEFIPEPGLVIRTTGGLLDFYMFLGPKPETVIQQYTEFVGRPFMIPYWALGFQISRYGYKNLDHMKEVLDRLKKYQIPVDTQVADIDHFDERKDFTVDPVNWKGLNEYLLKIEKEGMKTIMILDPALIVNETNYLPYKRGRDKNVFITWPGESPDYIYTNSQIMVGYCWPKGRVAYPDFLKKNTSDWWINEIIEHRKNLTFHGLWIDMNDPAAFGTNEERPFNWPEDDKPYWSLKCPDDDYENVETKASYVWRADNKLSDKTICMTAPQGENKEYKHYDVHNIYGHFESIATYEAAQRATNTRGIVITRSSFVGTGQYAGTWTGDNDSTWPHLYYSIIGMLEFNLFGIPYVGADICGFWFDTTPELCQRWQQVGAFYPFSRNHNQAAAREQDPANFTDAIALSSKKALDIRYEILPYYYTLFYKAHTLGNTVVRPLFHEFPQDEATYPIDRQFLVGPAVLITPVIEEGKVDVTGYFPRDYWYSYYNGALLRDSSNTITSGASQKIAAPLDFIPIHIRGGHIIPTQEPANTTVYSRKNPFGLIIALNDKGEATGELYYDDGESNDFLVGKYFHATFEVKSNRLVMNIVNNKYLLAGLKLNTIRIFAPSIKEFSFLVNSQTLLSQDQIVYEQHQIKLIKLNLDMNNSFAIEWYSSDQPQPILSSRRLDCLPKARLYPSRNDKIECEKRQNCVYDEIETDNRSPKCYYDTNKMKFKLVDEKPTDLGMQYIIASDYSPTSLTVDIEELTENTLRFKITTANSKRYEVPINLKRVPVKATNTRYEVKISTDRNNFYFKVIRKSTDTVLFDTSIGGLVFEDKKIQISTLLPSKYVYGFGENNHESFVHDISFKSWPIFNRDQAPGRLNQSNTYAAQTLYTVMEEDGHSHGVVLINSNAMDYEFIPEPGLIIRTTGGLLDFYMFLGPHPENVIQQYTEFVGRPFMIPYWALGFQISRYGYKNLDHMKEVLDRLKKYQIPVDTQVADIDHFDERKDFTVDPVNWKGLNEYLLKIEKEGMKTIMILDPALIVNETNYLPYKRGRDKNVFITWPSQTSDFIYTNSTIMVGYCWPKGRVAYPDFLKKNTSDWWINEIVEHRKTLTFHGLWIDMNDPAAFGTNEEKPFNWPEDDKPYWSLKCPDDDYENVETKASYVWRADNKLSDKTICMTAQQGENKEYKHYDVHNIYGHFEAIATFEAAQRATNTRGIVITRSSFAGTGKYAGTWTGDNDSKWSHLYYSIIGMLEYNLFGIPYVGADICGFWFDTNPELCQRWQQVGAFYPFSRNHNQAEAREQDPANFTDAIALSSKKALDIRYEILPYYYTLFYKAHTKGNTVVRALFHEFPTDKTTYPIDKQFLVGPGILISPVIDEGKVDVTAYFPRDYWYSYYDGTLLRNESNLSIIISGYWYKINAPLDFIPIHIRGGYIIPTQEPANTTVFSRQKPFGLIVALNENNDAKGDLYYDDGESKNFTEGVYYYATFIASSNRLSMNIEHNNYSAMSTHKLNTIRIFTPARKNFSFLINSQTIVNQNQISYIGQNEIKLTGLYLPMDQPFEIAWVDYELNSMTISTLIDCSVQNSGITEAECLSRKCEYEKTFTGTVPKCRIPRGVGGYIVTDDSDTKNIHLKRADDFSLYGGEIEDVLIKVIHGETDCNEHRFTRIKILDMKNERYEVPVQEEFNFHESTDDYLKVIVKNGTSRNNAAYIDVHSEKGDRLFSTENIEQGFVYSNQFIQIVMHTGYKNVYGLGENTHHEFKHKFVHSHFWPVFARDQPTGAKWLNLYGTHPFFMAVNEQTGRAYGVLILNSNAMEYGFIPPYSISYRTVGGILDMFVMEEESPEELIKAYTSLIGKPYLPPYWSLGFQLCRYGYDNLANLQAAVNRTIAAKIPLDVQYADIDHLRKQLDFTYDTVNFAGLPEYINYLNQSGIRFIIILDPAINSEEKNYTTLESGYKNDVWIKWHYKNNPQINELGGNNTYVLGYVWPEGKALFPDFFLQRTREWWKNEIISHYNNVLKFDGLWIDMNEPANFDTNEDKPFNYPSDLPPWNLKCPSNAYDEPPYLPIAAKPFGNIKKISDKTICMISVQNDGEYFHYDVHNLYGWSQTMPTLEALRTATNRRGIVISRSTYPSSGAKSGHWLGDNTSSWKDIKLSLIGMLEFNLFGIPYIGADICGFFEDTTPELCQRWMQLGAFNTFFRNHNTKEKIDQDPAVFGKAVASSTKEIVEIRYSLLPYLYTLFYNANNHGGTVIRSLVHEYPTDQRTTNIDRQFLWGKEVLISPVLEPNTRTILAYFPADRWFNYYTGEEIQGVSRMHEIDVPLDKIGLHIRGGSVLATQDPAMNTRLSRQNPFGLIIAPNDLNEERADGSLYWDGGEEINPDSSSSLIRFISLKNNNDYEINGFVEKNKFTFTNTLDTIRVFGQRRSPRRVEIVIAAVVTEHKNFTYNSLTQELIMRSLKINLNNDFKIKLVF